MKEFLARRKKLGAQLEPGSVVLLAGAKNLKRTSSSHHVFRQENNLYYFTGYPEADVLMAFLKDQQGFLKFIIFNISNDPDMEIWDGKKIGQEGACEIFGADEAYDIATIDTVMPNLLANNQNIYYAFAQSAELSPKIMEWLRALNQLAYGKEFKEVPSIPDTIKNLEPIIHEMRLIKDEAEIANLRRACEISAQAHTKLMRMAKTGLKEYQLEATFNQVCLHEGCRGMAYTSIVASGNNACTLHYINNSATLKDGDLVLVDAGAEYNNYAADITRTYPVKAKFTPAQRAIYELVLKAQLKGIEQVKPGNTFDMVQKAILEIMVPGLVQLGLLSGDAEQLLKDGAYKKYYMHSSGHWLGLDVHDPGKTRLNNHWREFVPGMVLTVEPGIYIASNLQDVDKKWLGIGVRIEDDVLVTKTGHEVLSQAAPKTIEEIERADV